MVGKQVHSWVLAVEAPVFQEIRAAVPSLESTVARLWILQAPMQGRVRDPALNVELQAQGFINLRKFNFHWPDLFTKSAKNSLFYE